MPQTQNPISDIEAQHLAAGLRFIPAQGSTPDPNLSTEAKLWYQGPERYFDLFVERQNAQITWVQITFRGQYLEWKDQHLKTGNTNEFTVSAQAEHPASKMLHAHEQKNLQFVHNILLILKHRPEDKVLGQITELISRAV